MISSTPPDMRIILLIVGFCFGALLEGYVYTTISIKHMHHSLNSQKLHYSVAGFGVPGAICSSMLVSLGYSIKIQFISET